MDELQKNVEKKQDTKMQYDATYKSFETSGKS